jgi:hypothetical protein
MKTTATTEAVSSPPEENELWNTKWRRNTCCAEQKPVVGWKNDLQIRGTGRKSRKPPTPFVGIKPYGKSQITNNMNAFRYMPHMVLLSALLCLTGCDTPIDAVKGYDMDWTHARYIDHPLDKAITDDVQNFIRSKKVPQSDISEITWGEDARGRHVSMITQEIPASQGMETTEYILYYDKHNVRKNVRTFHSRRSC